MKKLLSLFCAIAFLSGCSSFGTDGGLFGGSECESREARDFMKNAEENVFFAFDSSALSLDATEVVETQVLFKATATKEVPENTTWHWVNAVPTP